MLFTVIPSELYYKDLTLDTLLDAMVTDLAQMYDEGLVVASIPCTIWSWGAF